MSRLLFCLLSTSLFFSGYLLVFSAQPEAVRGVIYLQNWDLAAQGPVELNGEWRFYWQVARSQPTGNPDFISVPGAWNGHLVNNQRITGQGIATYHLAIHTNARYIGRFLL